jgi:hypothetical protein
MTISSGRTGQDKNQSKKQKKPHSSVTPVPQW